MTGREKIAAALSEEGSPAFAAVTCYQGIFLHDHWEEATEAPWWALHDPRPEEAARPWLDLVARTGEDWFPLSFGYSREAQKQWHIEAAEPEAFAGPGRASVWLVNRKTGERRPIRRPPVGGEPPHPEERPPASDVWDTETLEATIARIYGPREQWAAAPPEGTLDLPQLLVARLGATHMPIAHIPTPFWLCNLLFGFAGLMERVLVEPRLVQRACERMLEYTQGLVARWAAAGAALIWIEDCYSDLIRPEHFRDFNLAFLRPLVETIHAHKLLAVHYYCGRPDDRWAYLLDSGAEALALEESKKGFHIDIMEVAELVDGRLALFGNIDAIGLMTRGSEAALESEIARQIAAGRRNRNRFVVSVGSPITPATPLRRVRRFCELVHAMSG